MSKRHCHSSELSLPSFPSLSAIEGPEVADFVEVLLSLLLLDEPLGLLLEELELLLELWEDLFLDLGGDLLSGFEVEGLLSEWDFSQSRSE